MTDRLLTRRKFCKKSLLATSALGLPPGLSGAKEKAFKLRYILGSCLYGKLPLAEILPEVRETGARHVDVWPAVHGNQREQVEEMGHEKFAALLDLHKVRLGILTHFDLGSFKLRDEMRVAKKFGAKMLICGGSGPRGLQGAELKIAVRQFLEKMKPHLEEAEKNNVVIGIENHANNLVESPDSMRWLAELAPSKNIGVALAPYHLPQDARAMARLIEDLGDRLVHFYAWQHGKGCKVKLPKAEELLQMPGRGELDFTPILAALKKINYQGWTEIFMHPVPRGIPILPAAREVTAEINRSRRHLETCLEKTA